MLRVYMYILSVQPPNNLMWQRAKGENHGHWTIRIATARLLRVWSHSNFVQIAAKRRIPFPIPRWSHGLARTHTAAAMHWKNWDLEGAMKTHLSWANSPQFSCLDLQTLTKSYRVHPARLWNSHHDIPSCQLWSRIHEGYWGHFQWPILCTYVYIYIYS